ncbi:MAG: subB [Frankiales bacterium]|nr:subB [Frankiales bacterium]
MRITVDYDLCESNGVCVSHAPTVFDLRDDDNLYLLQEQPPEALRADLQRAVKHCPRQALTLVD